MWNQPQRILRIRLAILDADQPIERTVEVDATSRLEHLHGLIQSVFTWSGRERHVFTDRRSMPTDGDWAWNLPPRQRVWEMDHHCRDDGHVSDCEWTATVASALESRTLDHEGSAGRLFYEFGVDSPCPRYEYGSGCLVADLGTGLNADTGTDTDTRDARHAHGFTVAIEVVGERKARRTERVPTLLDGCGRAPLEEAGSIDGFTALNAVLDDPTHPRHHELDELARRCVGPWAATGTRAFAAGEFEPVIVAQALGLLSSADLPSPADLLSSPDLPSSPDLLAPTKTAPLPAALVGLASGIHHRHRIDVLTAASRLGLGLGLDDNPSIASDTAKPITAELAEALRQVATHAMDAPDFTDLDDSFDVAFLRALRLVVRRSGELRLTRAGERAADDPAVLLAMCGDAYWRVASDLRVGLHVLLGVAYGLAGDDLTERVIGTLETDRSAPRVSYDDRRGSGRYLGLRDGEDVIDPQIEQCIAFLARFGAFAAAASGPTVTADGHTLATTFLTH